MNKKAQKLEKASLKILGAAVATASVGVTGMIALGGTQLFPLSFGLALLSMPLAIVALFFTLLGEWFED